MSQLASGFGPLKLDVRPVIGKKWQGCIEAMLDVAIIFGPNENTRFVLCEDGFKVIEYLHDLYQRGELHPIPGSSADSLHALAMQCGFDFKKCVRALANKLQHGAYFPDSKKQAAIALLNSIYSTRENALAAKGK